MVILSIRNVIASINKYKVCRKDVQGENIWSTEFFTSISTCSGTFRYNWFPNAKYT